MAATRYFKIRDITTGLYMDKTSKAEPVTWHEAGVSWESVQDLEEHLRNLVDLRQTVSPMWEVEVIDVEMVERYPAVVHGPKGRK